MNTREIATQYRLSNWSQALSDRVARKESVKEFCKRKGISKNTYFYWQRKVREAAVQEMLPSVIESPSPIPAGWRQVEGIAVPKAEESELTIEIGKSRIKVNKAIDSELLTQVCKVLVEVC